MVNPQNPKREPECGTHLLPVMRLRPSKRIPNIQKTHPKPPGMNQQLTANQQMIPLTGTNRTATAVNPMKLSPYPTSSL